MSLDLTKYKESLEVEFKQIASKEAALDQQLNELRIEKVRLQGAYRLLETIIKDYSAIESSHT